MKIRSGSADRLARRRGIAFPIALLVLLSVACGNGEAVGGLPPEAAERAAEPRAPGGSPPGASETKERPQPPVPAPDSAESLEQAARALSEECAERRLEAEGDEKQRIEEECDRRERELDEAAAVPFAESAEPVAWEEGLAWWPYDPVLRSPTLPSPEAQESVHAWTRGEYGTESEVGSSMAALHVAYEVPPRTSSREDFSGMLLGGAVFVTMSFIPPGENVPYTTENLRGKPVTVRDRVARLVEFVTEGETDPGEGRFRVDEEGDAHRLVHWEEALQEGGTLQWLVYDHPGHYSRERTFGFIEDLVEAR